MRCLGARHKSTRSQKHGIVPSGDPRLYNLTLECVDTTRCYFPLTRCPPQKRHQRVPTRHARVPQKRIIRNMFSAILASFPSTKYKKHSISGCCRVSLLLIALTQRSRITMFEIEWDSVSRSSVTFYVYSHVSCVKHHNAHMKRRHPYRHKASTIHGWVTKLRGTLLGNEATRRRGIREMEDARTIRKAKRKFASERSGQRSGLFAFFRRSSVPKKQVIVVRRHRSSRKKKGDEPTLHVPHRAKPPYHGHGTLLVGYVTGDKDKTAQGRSMNRDATKERAKERRRRQRRRQKEAEVMRNDTRSSRRRHH